MKFQSAKLVKFTLIAALSLSAMNIVGAEPASCPTAFSVSPMGMPSCEPPTSPCPTAFNVSPSMACTPTELTPTEPTPAVTAPVVNYQENVSFNDTDLGVALFKSTDADGNEKMDLFNVETGSNISTYMFSITQADIAPYMAQHPAVNTKLASADGVAVYVLTTGEIQINAGPDAEGKIHVKIFDGIPWTHVYGYTIDPVK